MRINKAIILLLLITLFAGNSLNIQANAQQLPRYNAEAYDYYKKGLDLYQTGDYASAISQFEQALKLNPDNSSTRINLAAAYIARAGRFITLDPTKSANDYRRAIFYLQYDENLGDPAVLKENLDIATSNLSNVLADSKINLTPKNRLKIAKELRGQGSFREAIVEYNYALADNNSKFEAYEALGDIMRVLQKDTRAVEYYGEALSINSDNANLHLKIARALTKTGNNDAAVKEFNIALNLAPNDREIITAIENMWRSKIQENPQDAVAHMNLGVVLQKRGDLTGALSEYQAAQALDPANITLRLNLGTLFQAKGDLNMAMAAYDSILQINPTDSVVHYYRATALKQLGNLKGAIDEFQIALKIDPNNIQAKKALFDAVKEIKNPDERLYALSDLAKTYNNDASSLYNLAYELHAQKKYDYALEIYQRVITMNPGLADAYLNIAAIYKERNQYQEALSTLQNALVVNPNNLKAKNLLAQIKQDSTITNYESAISKQKKGDYTGAIEDFQRIIAENGAGADSYVGLGATYMAAEKTDDAINAFNKALELDKSNSPALYYLGNIYFGKKNYTKALGLYQKAQMFDPENPDVKSAIKDAKLAINDDMLQKGIDEFNAKRYTKALLLLNNTIQSNPNNGYAYYYRGMTYDAQKKYLQAIEDYKKAVSKSPDLKVAYYSLAIDYDTLKLKKEAKAAYKKFVDVSKNNTDEYVKYAKQRLRQL